MNLPLSFLHQWGRIDGTTAAGHFGELPVQDDKLRAVMAGWGQHDAGAALAWLKGQDRKFMSKMVPPIVHPAIADAYKEANLNSLTLFLPTN